MDSFHTSRSRSTAAASAVAAHPDRYRVLTGERPTGRLHIGHYFGSIAERVRLQGLGVQTNLVIADYQVITDRDTTAQIQENVHGAVLDYLAAGIDPDRAVIFTHSAVPALNQLMLPFLSLVTEAELRRNPTVKAELAASGRSLSGLLLTYPVHQAADILFCKANLVPVGKDNLPHVEVTRVIARRFNERYGQVFPEPVGLLSDAPETPGLDGRKMSKSYGNAIALGAGADETAALIRKSPTDSERRISYDPEHRPGVSALLAAAALCSATTPEAIADRIGDAGSGALKAVVIDAVNERFAEHRRRRREFENDPGFVRGIIRAGNEKARAIADETLGEVRVAMGMDY